MKILHCCLAAFYIDNYSYQENILPKMHKLQGHDITILASTETYISSAVLGYVKPSSYINRDGIPVTRIPYISWLPHPIAKKLRIYKGINKFVTEFNPDIIFLHDCQFIGIKEIVSFAKKNPQVKIYVDGHTDFINSARNWISKNILHKIIYKWCAKKIEPYTIKFYGVLPLRVEFFKKVYGIPSQKTELLLLGADHTMIEMSKRSEIRQSFRKKLNFKETDFVIVTGGKIDRRKNIHVLMKAVDQLQNENIKLLVFGLPSDEMKSEIEAYRKSKFIKNIGWIPSEKTYDYLLVADIVFFPGTHSVLWEQAIGLGLPCVFKKWEGIQHVDLNGNCIFLENEDIPEIKEKILKLYMDKKLLMSMKQVAEDRGTLEFSYYEIAKKAIEP
ncbi:MAG: glycosyltransferase family 4 protein [Bacteroidetes bacterium]|nr:glycosyltransferase family 4 protein [Bacteroidota bacterium]